MTRTAATRRPAPTAAAARVLCGLLVGFLLAGCAGPDESQDLLGRPHVTDRPTSVAGYALDPAPALQLSETREIGDGQRFALGNHCEESKRLMQDAERGDGTARHQVSWYSRQSHDVSVVRYDWDDEATFGAFAAGLLQDFVCLNGGPDQSPQLSGATAKLWNVRTAGTTSGATTIVVTLDGTVLVVSCDWPDDEACRTFTSRLLTALEVA